MPHMMDTVRDTHRRATGYFGGASPLILVLFGIAPVIVVAAASALSIPLFFAVTAALVAVTIVVTLVTRPRTSRNLMRSGLVIIGGLVAMIFIGYSGISIHGFGQSWSAQSLFVAVCVFSAIFGFTHRAR